MALHLRINLMLYSLLFCTSRPILLTYFIGVSFWCRTEGEIFHLHLFGGDTGVACQRLNDLWTASLGSRTEKSVIWSRQELLGDEPPARSNCASACKGDSIYIYGGWDLAGKTFDSLGFLILFSFPLALVLNCDTRP